MKTPVRVASISVNQTPLAWDENEQNLRAGLEDARRQGASVVCFPELCVTGYGCEDAFSWPGTWEQAQSVLEALLPDCRGLVASFGLPLAIAGELFNTAALVVDGEIAGFSAKRHLAGMGLHYEPRWFRPWPKGLLKKVQWSGRTLPVGDLLFDVGGVRIGFEICEDAWVQDRPGYELAEAGVQLVLNPSASHFAFGKHAVRRQLVLTGAREFGCGYVYANLLGNEAGRAIYDGDAVIAHATPSGDAEVLAETRRLSFRPRQMACATLDVEQIEGRNLSALTGTLTSRIPPRGLVSVPFVWPPNPSDTIVSDRVHGLEDPAHPEAELEKEEAFGRAIALGLFDYARKSHSSGFVVSLSGGADSAVVALLVRLMVKLGTTELGQLGFLERLGWESPEELVETDEHHLVSRFLTTVYQATANSSLRTREAASAVAQGLGAAHHEFDVQCLVDQYQELTEQALGRQLTWDMDDVALQNIQARARAPSVWMLANVKNALLLATSNRSEAAVGYATMDGDTAGGLSPIAGIDKAFLRKWLRFMETRGISELGPVALLSVINSQEPTAELRPPTAVQTDESDLMPYEVLDAIERLAIVQRHPPRAVLDLLVENFPRYDRTQLQSWVSRFYRLFARNQWKRERYAPSFHVDDANLDPKTWCRFPILSGGFRRELRELEQ